jgi:hypothetical protein
MIYTPLSPSIKDRTKGEVKCKGKDKGEDSADNDDSHIQ